jgi:hypothetical protein
VNSERLRNLTELLQQQRLLLSEEEGGSRKNLSKKEFKNPPPTTYAFEKSKVGFKSMQYEGTCGTKLQSFYLQLVHVVAHLSRFCVSRVVIVNVCKLSSQLCKLY